MISVDSLTVCYGKLKAVNNVSVEVPDGEVFGLIGPNGAGKTTAMKVLAGLLLPAAGTVRIDGYDVVCERAAVQARIGYMVDFFGVYDYLAVTEYLEFFAGVYGVPPGTVEKRIAEVLEIVKLTHKKTAMIHELSRGMKQRLYFARTLVHSPSLLILDEPASGMDPRGRSELMQALREWNEATGKTIVISSHILDELEQICTSVGIMETGSMVGTRSLRGGGKEGEKERRVLLAVAAADRGRARTVLSGLAQVSDVGERGDEFVLTLPDSDSVVREVIDALAGESIALLLPRADAAPLEQTFFTMTKGETT